MGNRRVLLKLRRDLRRIDPEDVHTRQTTPLENFWRSQILGAAHINFVDEKRVAGKYQEQNYQQRNNQQSAEPAHTDINTKRQPKRDGGRWQAIFICRVLEPPQATALR